MSNIVDRVAAAFEALQGRIAELDGENNGLKNRVQILEGLLNSRIPPDRVQLDEQRYIARDVAGNWIIRTAKGHKSLGRLNHQTAEIIDACLGYKP